MGAFDNTFIALIPKMQLYEAYEDYRPIPSWSLIYKLISMAIVDHLKCVLSGLVFEGFLDFYITANSMMLLVELKKGCT